MLTSFLVSLAMFIGGQGGAASKPKPSASISADRVVTQVQRFYQTTAHLSAIFRQTTMNATFGIPKQSDGRVYLRKPGKFRFDYVCKRNTSQVCKAQMSDGATIWVIDYSGKWYYTQPLNQSALPVAVTFLTGKGNLTSEFNPRLDTSGKYGAPGDLVLELTPRQPSAQFRSLFLVVDPADYRVKQSIVINAAGDVNQFRFYQPDVVKDVPDTWFVFNPRAPAAKGFRQIKPQQANPPAPAAPPLTKPTGP